MSIIPCVVCEQMQLEKFDFFPLNRALSLSAMDEDSTESKVDDLLRQVHTLVERQREEVRQLLSTDCLTRFLLVHEVTGLHRTWSHGRKSRPVPQNLEWGTLIQIVPRFRHVSKC